MLRDAVTIEDLNLCSSSLSGPDEDGWVYIEDGSQYDVSSVFELKSDSWLSYRSSWQKDLQYYKRTGLIYFWTLILTFTHYNHLKSANKPSWTLQMKERNISALIMTITHKLLDGEVTRSVQCSLHSEHPKRTSQKFFHQLYCSMSHWKLHVFL